MKHLEKAESEVIKYLQEYIDEEKISKDEFDVEIDSVIVEVMPRVLNHYVYTEDNLEILRDLNLWDFSHLLDYHSCGTIEDLCFYELREQISYLRNNITNITNYAFKY